IGRPKEHRPNLTPKGEYTKLEYPGIDVIVHKVNKIFTYITRKWTVDGKNLRPHDKGAALTDPEKPIYIEAPVVPFSSTISNNVSPYIINYAEVFSEMIFYNTYLPGSGLVISKDHDSVNNADAQSDFATNEGPQLSDFKGENNQYEPLLFNGSGNNKTLDTRFISRYHQLYNWEADFTPNRSALFAFNQLVAKYIQQTYDTSSQKIYSGVINKFAN